MNAVDPPFDSAYVKDDGSSGGATSPDLKSFIKEPIPPAELRLYGTSKPTRKIVRAKLIDDKRKNR